MRAKRLISAACAVLTLTPTLAFAHTGLGATPSFLHGLEHPVAGLDHVLAMVLVGVIAFRIGSRALWLVPAAFLLMMAAGGLLGYLHVDIPLVETGIAVSVILLGVLVALGIRPSLAAAVGLAGLFAVFHGYAHGAELPAGAGGVGYGLGFMTATALLHGAGIGLGYGLAGGGWLHGKAVERGIGGIAAMAGAGILVGVL